MIAASFLFGWTCPQCSLRLPTEITFGQWPQVSDSVWLIATAVMPENPSDIGGDLLRLLKKQHLARFSWLGPPGAFIHGEDFPTH